MNGIIRLIFVLVALAVYAGAAPAAEVKIFMSPAGSDINSGLSQKVAVSTLQRAIDIAESAHHKNATSIRIMIGPGVYRGQVAVAHGHTEGIAIFMEAADAGGARPHFDGNGRGGTWLIIRPEGKANTNFRIQGLDISNYETAISIEGNRNKRGQSAGGNEIRRNVFKNIGQIASRNAQPSTAAVRLVNSDNNIIIKNSFITIRNREKCGLLHAIYVAHDSTGNTITENTFRDSCGDTIRFRDRSDFNIVKNNTFIDAWGNAPVSDWYCDRSKSSACTKATAECPSLNNILENNRIIGNKRVAPQIFKGYSDDATSNCTMRASDRRVIMRR
jgi:hypothetical protein